MKILKPTEVRSLEQFFQLKQENLLKIMKQYLSTKYKTVYSTNSYIIAVGDIPIALVAHLDTVFSIPPKDIFYDRNKNVMWSPDGLGADDRAGVYAIVQLIKRGFRPTIIFTTDEEKGALGAEKLIREYPEPPTDLKYIIELDRRGSTDCVFYDCDNSLFEEYVEQFGFITAFGTFSDISVICPAWGMAGVNLSIGYVNEHSYAEILYISNMFATINKVDKMLKDADNVKEIFEYIPTKYSGYFTYTKTDDDFGWDPSYGISKSLWKSWHSPQDLMTCSGCGTNDYDYNLFATKTPSGKTIFLCSDCISKAKNIDWCKRCGEPFLIDKDAETLSFCYDCCKEDK